jgi:type IV secretory pathway protease TraF
VPKFLRLTTYAVAVLAVAVAMVLVWLKRPRVEISLSDGTMRPAIGRLKTRFDINAAWLDAPRRNTIVAFIPPDAKTFKYRASRVVALAGDRIEVHDRKAYVNGTIPKGAERSLPTADLPEFVVPRDCVYVLNDFPENPDSIDFGPLPLWRVVGELVLK